MGPQAKKELSPEDDVAMTEILKVFFICHWRGVLILLAPIVLLVVLSPFPPTIQFDMPRTYKPDPRGKTYRKYDENIINEAVAAYANGNFSFKEIAEKYAIDKSVLYRHSIKTMKKQGGQTILTDETEEYMIKYINIIMCGMGIPFRCIGFENAQWVGYTLMLMAVFWVSECIPLAVTAFLPLAIFPIVGVTDTRLCCANYMNDTIMMFIGSLVLASSVEQSGLHKRLAYCSIQTLGYSHMRLLLAMCCVTCFASMWITNTAATTMMTPIIFALLKVFEDQGVIVLYEKTADGDLYASDITSCYFCAVTFSATVGGIGTLVGTGTNLVFKGFFGSTFPTAPEYLSFPMFSAFAVPYMILLEIPIYLYLAILYFGFLRPGSKTAKKSKIPIAVQQAAAAVIAADVKKRGTITFWEVMVVVLFGGAMISFFCRSPQIFSGWGDELINYFMLPPKYIRDSALAMFVSFLMFLFPRDKSCFHNFTAKYREDLPKERTGSVLCWKTVNDNCPYAFSFLLGGGFTLSDGASTSGLNEIIGEYMKSKLINLNNVLVILIIIIVVIFITNFASNVAVCTVFTPLAMQLAQNIGQNPLWYNLASGFSASYCFMIPVGTPGNLIVQSAAKVRTSKMMVCGFGPTISTIIITWLAMLFWAPIVFPDIKTMPAWINNTKTGN